MEQNLQEVRRDIEQTRVALGDKISLLEKKIETTKNTTLNPAYHMRTRPWPTLGMFVAAGWVFGRFMKSRFSSNSRRGRVAERPGMIREVARSTTSSAASVVGLLVGDFIREFVNKRRQRRKERRERNL
jgi:hypothetical protein